MFLAKYITLLILPIILAVATPMPNPLPLPGGGTPTTKLATTTITVTVTATETVSVSECNTGPLLCCNDVQSASSESATSLLGLLGIVLHDVNVLIGLSCDPLSVLGVGSGGCASRPVCCQNNTFSGLIAIGCVPITINL